MIPSKTFLIGEYLALQGGPSLVAATSPCFSLQSGGGVPPHPESPAGVYARRLGMGLDFSLCHPHPRVGGFGASTAEFLYLYSKQESDSKESSHRPVQLLESYRSCLKNRASGADVIAQAFGQISYWDEREQEHQTMRWPFGAIKFSLYQTTHKVATHEHLEDVKSQDFSDLRASVVSAVKSLKECDAQGFVSSIRDFSRLLHARGLVCDETQEKLLEIREMPGVLAAKGCGAMGSDVIAVFHDSSGSFASSENIASASLCGMDFIADSNDLCRGYLQ